MKTVIGLAGVKTSGKSTVANIIKGFVEANEAALADKLKNTCASTFGLTREYFDSQDLKEVPFGKPLMVTRTELKKILTAFNIPEDRVDELRHLEETLLTSPRHIAQFVGTEILRSLGNPDIHCESVELLDGVTIISDMRFPNEYEYFSAMADINFIPLYVARNEAESQITPDSHPSETSVFIFKNKCTRLDNNGTLEQLEANIKSALEGKL